MRKPWRRYTVISKYVGSRNKFRDTFFSTGRFFLRRRNAARLADRWNSVAERINYSYGPGKDFRFEVVSCSTSTDPSISED